MYNLSTLNMSHNNLETISVNLLTNTVFLSKLDLSYNRIKYIEELSFQNLAMLTDLYLIGNNDQLALDSQNWYGVKMIKIVYFNKEYFFSNLSVSNVQAILESFKLNVVRNLTTYVYLNSIDLIFRPAEKFQQYCDLSLSLMRNNLHLNLHTDDDAKFFLSICSLKSSSV